MRNFELILVVLTLVMGVVWLVDALFFAKRRKAKGAANEGATAEIEVDMFGAAGIAAE